MPVTSGSVLFLFWGAASQQYVQGPGFILINLEGQSLQRDSGWVESFTLQFLLVRGAQTYRTTRALLFKALRAFRQAGS